MNNEPRKYFRLAAAEHPEYPGKYGIVMVGGGGAEPDGDVMSIGPADSDSADAALQKFARAIGRVLQDESNQGLFVT